MKMGHQKQKELRANSVNETFVRKLAKLRLSLWWSTNPWRSTNSYPKLSGL